jgi:hypothetical protein
MSFVFEAHPSIQEKGRLFPIRSHKQARGGRWRNLSLQTHYRDISISKYIKYLQYSLPLRWVAPQIVMGAWYRGIYERPPIGPHKWARVWTSNQLWIKQSIGGIQCEYTGGFHALNSLWLCSYIAKKPTLLRHGQGGCSRNCCSTRGAHRSTRISP